MIHLLKNLNAYIILMIILKICVAGIFGYVFASSVAWQSLQIYAAGIGGQLGVSAFDYLLHLIQKS